MKPKIKWIHGQGQRSESRESNMQDKVRRNEVLETKAGRSEAEVRQEQGRGSELEGPR